MGSCVSRPKHNRYRVNETSKPEEIQRINEYLFSLYEHELKFKRTDAEVQSITSAVENMVEKIMAAVGNENPLYEPLKQYLVGSMAEETSIIEPNEFDFLVVLKYFSNQSDKSKERSLDKENMCKVYGRGIQVNLTGTLSSKLFNESGFSTNLNQVLSSSHFQSEACVEPSKYGKLFIRSTTVCRHGPACVIKLEWQPSSKTSKPIDILVDITPCIELQGIDKVIKARDVPITAHYEALARDNKYIFIPWRYFYFALSYTTTEVKIVRALSSFHKMCYMILKYCLNNLTLKDKRTKLHESLFSSYIIKTFTLRHAAGCKTTNNTTMSKCFNTCLVDILQDIKRQINKDDFGIDGILSKIDWSYFRSKYVIHLHINKIIEILHIIGKDGNTPSNNIQFTKTCHRDVTQLAEHECAFRMIKIHNYYNEDCHLQKNCLNHLFIDNNIHYLD